MKKVYLLLLILISGCSIVPVQRNFPEVPPELEKSCPDLKKTPYTEKLSEVVDVVVDNYSQYHECQEYVMRWNEWYKAQKQIFEEVK